jgi:hypothetical protein
MNNDKVLLIELRERTSASGNVYLSGWLGKASVVGFLDRESEEKVWRIFVSTPQQKTGGSSPRRSSGGQGFDRPPRRAATQVPSGTLDDDISDLR